MMRLRRFQSGVSGWSVVHTQTLAPHARTNSPGPPGEATKYTFAEKYVSTENK